MFLEVIYHRFVYYWGESSYSYLKSFGDAFVCLKIHNSSQYCEVSEKSHAVLWGQITNDDKNLKDILQRTIKVKRQDGAEVWETLVDKAHLESKGFRCSHDPRGVVSFLPVHKACCKQDRHNRHACLEGEACSGQP